MGHKLTHNRIQLYTLAHKDVEGPQLQGTLQQLQQYNRSRYATGGYKVWLLPL